MKLLTPGVPRSMAMPSRSLSGKGDFARQQGVVVILCPDEFRLLPIWRGLPGSSGYSDFRGVEYSLASSLGLR